MVEGIPSDNENYLFDENWLSSLSSKKPNVKFNYASSEGVCENFEFIIIAHPHMLLAQHFSLLVSRRWGTLIMNKKFQINIFWLYEKLQISSPHIRLLHTLVHSHSRCFILVLIITASCCSPFTFQQLAFPLHHSKRLSYNFMRRFTWTLCVDWERENNYAKSSALELLSLVSFVRVQVSWKLNPLLNSTQWSS